MHVARAAASGKHFHNLLADSAPAQRIGAVIQLS